MSNILYNKPKISKNIVVKQKENKVLLIDCEGVSYVTVSKSMASFLLTLDGTKTVQEIINELHGNNNEILFKRMILVFEKLYKLNIFQDDCKELIEQKNILNNVFFNLTKKCNLKCSYCYASADINNQIEEKDLEFWKKQVLDLKEINKDARIIFTGGEATLYKYFWQLAKFIKENNISLNLISNGTILKTEDIENLKKYFTEINISIDSLNENINSLTRGIDVLEKSKKFVDALIEKGIKPTIMVVVTQKNKNCLKEIQDYFENKAIITFQYMCKVGRASKNNDFFLTPDEYYNALQKLNKKFENLLPVARKIKIVWCGMGKNTISIESNGLVHPCQALHNEKFLLGNLNKQPLKEIFNNSPYKKTNLENIDGCSSCEIKFFCGGACRARAFYTTGNILGKDPLCNVLKNEYIYNMFNPQQKS